jgi:hypothetical protein
VAIVIHCPGCKTRLTLGDDRAGQCFDCPRCNTQVAVPLGPRQATPDTTGRGRRTSSTTPSHIHFLSETERLSLAQVVAQPFTALLVTGIVNPWGPTLTAIGALGSLRPRAKLPVVWLMLNPFTQEHDIIGELVVGQPWRPDCVIPQLFDLPFGSCPSVLLPNEQLEAGVALSLHAEFLRRFTGARSLMERVRAYYGNPWERVSQEMAAATQSLAEGFPAERTEIPLTEREAAELAGMLLAEQHSSPEVQALFHAWKGSVEHAPFGGMALGVDSFGQIAEHVCSAVRVPRAPGW